MTIVDPKDSAQSVPGTGTKGRIIMKVRANAVKITLAAAVLLVIVYLVA